MRCKQLLHFSHLILRFCYEHLDAHSNMFTLTSLHLANQTWDYCMSWISLDNALYISQTFEENISKVLNAEINFDVEESSSEV